MRSNLKQSPLAWKVRRSPLYKAWRRFRAPDQVERADRERAFYRAFLPNIAGHTALDIGANDGGKTDIFRALGARVVAVEADPDVRALLQRRFAGDRNVVIEHAAAAAETGVLELMKFEGNEAYNTASADWAKYLQQPNERFGDPKSAPRAIRVPAVTLASLIERHGPIRYLKVDVEGLEWAVLSTLTVAIPRVSLEFNLPMFQEDLVRCVEHLARLDAGYRFNVAITEPPLRFELDGWLPADTFVTTLAARGWGYAEVYARLEGVR